MCRNSATVKQKKNEKQAEKSNGENDKIHFIGNN